MQSHQNSNVILHRNRKTNPKIHMELKKTLNDQINPEPKRAMTPGITEPQ
jgi:hypothetical protein